LKQVKIGLVGLGGMAPVHLEQIRQIPGAAISAICDISGEKLAEWGDKLQIGSQSRYSQFEQLILDPEVDAVLSVTPNHMHYEINRFCLLNGKPFMAEKPFTRTFAEAQALLDISRTHPTACMVGFSYRYVPSFRMAREMIRSGKLGTIRHLSIQYLQQWGGPLFDIPMNWRWDRSVSGTGVLGDLGSHMVDAARFLVGEPLEISALMRNLIPQRKDPVTGEPVDVDIDDFAAFTAVLEGDVPAVFQTSRNAYGCGNGFEISVYGDLGSLHMDWDSGDFLTWTHENEEKSVVREKIAVPDRHKVKQMQDFVDLARGLVREETPALEDGYRNMLILEAVQRADTERRTVRIEELEAFAQGTGERIS
jgi:predicted dehydrogenase